MSMYKNKTLYQPRTADPNTLTLENLLTLANIITSGIDHYSPSLGAFTSVQVAMPTCRNMRQQVLANVFGTFQPAISKAVNT